MVESDQPLYDESEASQLNMSHAVQVPNEKEIKLNEEEMEHLQRSGDKRHREDDDDNLSRGGAI